MQLNWQLIKGAHRATEQDKMGEVELINNAHNIRVNLLYNAKRVKKSNSRCLQYEPGMRLEFISLRKTDGKIARYLGHSELQYETMRALTKSLKTTIENRHELREAARRYIHALSQASDATLTTEI